LDGSPDAFLIRVNRRGKVLTSTGWERSKRAFQALRNRHVYSIYARSTPEAKKSRATDHHTSVERALCKEWFSRRLAADPCECWLARPFMVDKLKRRVRRFRDQGSQIREAPSAPENTQ
jgi:hypothetical protein